MKQHDAVLITGGSGFIGKNVIEELRRSRPDLALHNFSTTPLNIDGVTDIVGDARSFDLQTINTPFSYIIHCLALSNEKYCANFAQAKDINIRFTKKVLDFAVSQRSLKKLVHISSIILYDNADIPPVPETAQLFLHYTNYSFTKGIAEHYVNHYRKKFSVPSIIFRLSNIYGPHQSFKDSPFLVPSKIVQALSEGKIEVFNTKPRRDWIYAEDAAGAIVVSLGSNQRGTFNLASGSGISVGEIVSEIGKQLGVQHSSLDKPTTGPTDFYCDISKIKTELNWQPTTTLERGITNTIAYIKNHYCPEHDFRT